MEKSEEKLLDFLLADFASIKSEISRRSNLQKAVTAAVFAFYAWMFERSISSDLGMEVVTTAWLISFLAYTFYIREADEIRKLGWKIKNDIAEPVSKIIGVSAEKVIPSQAHSKNPGSSFLRRCISNSFMIIVYLVIPLIFTVSYWLK